MVKVALLIGVSEYQAGLNALPGAVKDIAAMQQVLQHREMGGFDEVKTLPNAEPQAMQEAIETLFSGLAKDDLALLFFSGHGIKDDRGRLYFATRVTRKSLKGDLIKSTAVPASFVHDIMSNSRCKRQVVILDCCFSGAFVEGMTAKDDGTVDVQAQLGAEGRAVLTSSTSTQYSFEQQDSDLSVYTRYIVEGIDTGAADLDNDGKISINELHEYARKKVQEAAPAMKPKIYAVEEGFKIYLAQAPADEPKLKYRREVERCARRGEISEITRYTLATLRESLGLSSEQADAIESEVLQPYRERQRKLQQYEQALVQAIKRDKSLSDATREDLKYLQQILGLRDEDIALITTHVAPRATFRLNPNIGANRTNVKLVLLSGGALAVVVLGVLAVSVGQRPQPTPSSTTGESLTTTPEPTSSALAQSPTTTPEPTSSSTPAESSTTTSSSQLSSASLYNRAVDKGNKGDNRGAIEDYTQAIELNKNWGSGTVGSNYSGLSSAYLNRGNARSDLGDKQGAIADYTWAIKINPEYAIAYYNRGNARSDLGDKQGAIADYTWAIKINPEYASAYYNRGFDRSDLGDNQGAIQDYNQAIKLKPDYADAHYNRGKARKALGDNQGAIQDYNQAIKLKPDLANAHYNRGLARKGLKDKKGAIQDFQQAAKLYQQQGKTQDYQDAQNRIKELQQQ